MTIEHYIDLDFKQKKSIEEVLSAIEKDPKFALKRHPLLQITLLHAAARDGAVELAEKLIERGAALDALDIDGNTALHYAFENGNWEFAKLLVLRGANACIANQNGQLASAMTKSYDWSAIISPDVFISKPLEQAVLHTGSKRAEEIKKLTEFVVEQAIALPTQSEIESERLQERVVLALSKLTESEPSQILETLLKLSRGLVTGYNIFCDKVKPYLPAAEDHPVLLIETDPLSELPNIDKQS